MELDHPHSCSYVIYEFAPQARPAPGTSDRVLASHRGRPDSLVQRGHQFVGE